MKRHKKIVVSILVGLVMLLFIKIPINASANTVLGPDITSYIDSRSSTVSVGVYDANTGNTYTYNPSITYQTLSIVKMSILANVLYNNMPIGDYENSLLTKMIVSSDNSAASTFWSRLGSDKKVQAFFNQVGMTNTIAGTGGWWGRTTTNVLDQLTIMKYFAYPNTLLTDTQRKYGLNLMRNVQSDQRWGTSAGIPSGVSIALKNGWYTSGTYVNSVGYINGQGKNYVISVLTTNNTSFSYAVETINTISSMVWNEIPSYGWVLSDGNWYFYTTGGKFTGWLPDNGQWYYLDTTGIMKTGWLKSDGSWYYLNSNGAMRTGWLYDGGAWYFLDHTGAMETGWLKTSGKWYYLQSDGAMRTGWLLDDGKWYYLQSSGEMLTGWTLYGGQWYYLNQSGAMETGWLDLPEEKYYLADSGERATGWQQINGKWYYFDQNGKMAADTVIQGHKLDKDGAWIQVNYVALGDSLASGMTPQGQDRSPVNGIDPDWGYPNYIAENFAKSYQLLEFSNFGVSGYTTENVIMELGKEAVQQEIKKATHLTIDIGANDLLLLLQKDPANVLNGLPIIEGEISKILSTIDQLNPNVKVYVMGYYNPFPYVTDSGKREQLNQLLQAFNAQIQNQADQHGDTYVPTSQVINVHEFADFIPNSNNIHLSLLGYQVVAEEFWKVIE